LISAAKAMVADKDYLSKQLPSLGCNIKWTQGNEPEWFK